MEASMFTKGLARSRHTPAGYAALIERYGVDVVPNWHISLVAEGGARRLTSHDGVVEETYPSSYWPGETACDHLEFALKYDGTNLALLYILFRTIEEKDILEHIRSRPGGVHFCPLVRRTEALVGYEKANLAERCRRTVAAYPSELLRRALGYLYNKEIKIFLRNRTY